MVVEVNVTPEKIEIANQVFQGLVLGPSLWNPFFQMANTMKNHVDSVSNYAHTGSLTVRILINSFRVCESLSAPSRTSSTEKYGTAKNPFREARKLKPPWFINQAYPQNEKRNNDLAHRNILVTLRHESKNCTRKNEHRAADACSSLRPTAALKQLKRLL